MIINEIQLTNIGAYKGTQSFDLRPETDKNVILIGGENGAGKTTLLNAIKLGLFGSYSYGYKTENAEYYKKVESTLNYTSKKLNENNYKIVVQFSLIDDFEKTDYTLTRTWKYVNTSLKETYDLSADGVLLNEQEKDLFQSKLKEIMPPQLLDLCLFDGEEIARIVSEDLLSDYLKNLSRIVFNLDLFETLEEDLETYSKQALDVKKLEESEQELFTLNNREKNLRIQIIEVIETLTQLQNEKNELQDDYQRLKSDFEINGGLVQSEREKILKQMNEIENERKQNQDQIKSFVSTLLPFNLCKDLLTETREQMQNEEAFHLFNQLQFKLTDETMKTMLDKLPGSFDDDTSKQFKNQLLDLMRPEKEIHQIHGASFSESSLIENMHNTTNSSAKMECLSIVETNQIKLKEHQQLREKLKANDSAIEFSSMIQQMESNLNKIVQLEKEIQVQEEALEEYKQQLDHTIEAITKLQSTLKDRDKTVSSFMESQKIITLSRRFREMQIQKKLQQVQIEASIMLKRIFRKHNYVSTIQIDHKTYDVTLIGSHNDQIEKATLSAGEKEILLISLIWSIFKCSGRKVPFIFDTLLGRLDKTHKAAVLKEFIPICGKQAIILSTDTEIDEAHYRILEDHVAKEYMLEFNVEKKETRIIKQYFSFKQMEMNL